MTLGCIHIVADRYMAWIGMVGMLPCFLTVPNRLYIPFIFFLRELTFIIPIIRCP